MKKFKEPASRRQQDLLPRSVEEFVPESDISRYIDSLVDELDLSLIESCYSYIGRRGFAPRIMVKLLVYGKLRGIRSSRQLAQACRENLKFIFITSGEQPDFRTISLFRKQFSKELAGILQQSISIGLDSGLIDLEHVAIDGTLVKSFAGDNSYKTPEYLAKELALVEHSIERDVKDEESVLGKNDDTTVGSLPKQYQDPKKLKAKLQTALEKHRSYAGKPKREQPKRISVTDPECRYTRKGPAYNGQAAVDEKSRMVVAGFATSAVADSAQLVPVLREIEANTGRNPKMVTADAGYNARSGLVEMEQRNIEGYIPQRKDVPKGYPIDKFHYDSKSDNFLCPEGKLLKRRSQTKTSFLYRASMKDCKHCKLRDECFSTGKTITSRIIHLPLENTLVQKMNQRVNSELGKKMAKKRSATVETVFGHIKYIRKLRCFLFRGMNMVNNIWKFELAVYNLEQIIRLRKQKSMTA